MRTSVVAVVAGVLVLAAGGGYYGLEVYPQQRFRADLDRTLATLPAGMTATYKDAHYAVLSKQATVTGVTMHAVLPGASPLPFDMTIDSVETTNPNLDFGRSWADAVAHPGTLTSDTALPVADSIIVKGVAIHSATINGAEEDARIDKLRLYPWALLHDGIPSWTQVQASLASSPQPPTLADMQPVLRFEAAEMLGIAFDSCEAGQIKFAGTLPGIDFAYAIQKTSGVGFDRGVIKGMTGEGLTFKGNKIGTFSVDRVTMGASDLAAPMVRLVKGEALSAALLDGIAIGRAEYAGITIQPPDKPAMHVGSFWVGPVAFAKGMPVSGTLGWQDIGVSRSQVTDAKAQAAFEKLGLETITTSFAISYDWDVAQQHAVLHDTTLKVNELGTLVVSAELNNVAASADALNQVQLAHARLRLDDASLVERLLRMGATQAGADLGAFRQQIVAVVNQRSAAMSGGSPLLVAAGQAVADFITSPHSLTVELSPPAPVPFVAFKGAAADPGAFAATLGLKVSANQP